MELASCPPTHPSPSPLNFSLPFPPSSSANAPSAPTQAYILHLHFPTTRSFRTTLALAPTISLSIDFATVSLSVDFASIFPLPRRLALLRLFNHLSLLHRLTFNEKLPQEAPTQPWLSLPLRPKSSLSDHLSLVTSLSLASLSRSAPTISLPPNLPSTKSFLMKLPSSPGCLSLSPDFSLHFASPSPSTTTIFHSLSLPDTSIALSLCLSPAPPHLQ